MGKRLDFSDVMGQEHCKRGLEVATAGGHNVLLIGPPHAGKATLKARVKTIEPIQIPAYYIKVASMLPCACGYFTDPKKECHCTPHKIQKHIGNEARRLDIDKIDIHLEVPRLNLEHLTEKRRGEASAEIQKRTISASEWP